MKRVRIALTILVLGVLLVPGVSAMSPAQGNNPNEDCPEGTALVAKFEIDDDGNYAFEKPDGNKGIVVIVSGDQTGGTWESSVLIYVSIVKGSTDTFTYYYAYDHSPGAYMGSFSNEYLEPNPSGQPPALSNIQFCGKPTVIELASFTASPGVSSVILAWETGTELDNAGFNLYRATSPDGPYAKINGALIAAEGDPVAGASYRFLDKGLTTGTYYYLLEDVDYNGVRTQHGPASATVLPSFRKPAYRPTVPGF